MPLTLGFLAGCNCGHARPQEASVRASEGYPLAQVASPVLRQPGVDPVCDFLLRDDRGRDCGLLVLLPAGRTGFGRDIVKTDPDLAPLRADTAEFERIVKSAEAEAKATKK